LDALDALRIARREALAEAGELAAERNAVAAEARRGDRQAGERIASLNRRTVELATRIDHYGADESALAERIGETLELAQRAMPGRPDGVAIARALEAQFARADELMRDLGTTFLACSALNRRLASTRACLQTLQPQ
jgi:seryl-tRNA synthetase